MQIAHIAVRIRRVLVAGTVEFGLTMLVNLALAPVLAVLRTVLIAIAVIAVIGVAAFLRPKSQDEGVIAMRGRTDAFFSGDGRAVHVFDSWPRDEHEQRHAEYLKPLSTIALSD